MGVCGVCVCVCVYEYVIAGSAFSIVRLAFCISFAHRGYSRHVVLCDMKRLALRN